MLKNYISTVLRQVLKNKSFSLINIFGLALGIAACLVIAQFVSFHSSFDQHHELADRIVRLERRVVKNGGEAQISAESTAIMSETLVNQSPLVEQRVRFWNIDYQNHSLLYKNQKNILAYSESGVFAVDKSVFELFDHEFIAGGSSNFSGPHKMVLNESTAKKYFDNPKEAIGQTVELKGNAGSFDFEVVGIVKDQPKNSHIDYNILFSLKSIDSYYPNSRTSWTNNNVNSYLLLSDAADKDKVLKTVENLYEKNAQSKMSAYGYDISYSLMDLKDIHTRSKAITSFKASIDFQLLYGLSIIAFIILLTAWINYLNLSLVKTMDRLKEVGIRKSLGSSTGQITVLFMIEAIFLNVLSFAMALTLAQITAPFTSQMTGLQFNVFENANIVLVLFGSVVIGALLIGLYPTFLIRTFNIFHNLTASAGKKKIGNTSVSSFLVGLQFAITFSLITVTIAVYQQLSYMKNADLGININDIMVINSPAGDVGSQDRVDIVNYNAFKTSLLQHSDIQLVTNAGEIPGEPIGWKANLRLKNSPKEKAVQTGLVSMGLEFLDFFELKTIAGRPLRQGDDPWSKGDVVINEKLATALGFEDPSDAIGEKIDGFHAPLIVRGVIENHHHSSLHHDYSPIAYILSSWTEFYFVKFKINKELTPDQRVERYSDLVTLTKNEWSKVFTQLQLDYFFLDQSFNRQYENDEQFGKIFASFSILAIFIACLGLFGLTSFTLQQRTKEIGIRKVLGAKTSHLVTLFSRGYISLIAVAYVISMPFVWYYLKQWLENFHFQIPLAPWIFVVPLFSVIFVAVFTILTRIIGAISKNPIDSLRYE